MTLCMQTSVHTVGYKTEDISTVTILSTLMKHTLNFVQFIFDI